MEYIADIVIVAIIVISVIVGYKKGLVRTLFACLAVLCAVIVSYHFGFYVGDFIKTTDIYERMSSRVVSEVSEYIGDVAQGEIEKVQGALEDFEKTELAQTLSRIGFDSESALSKYRDSVAAEAENMNDGYAQGIIEYILSCLANALGYLITFIAALIVLKILSYVIEKIFRLPILKTVNRLGGAAAGAVAGLFWAYVFCMALEILLPYIPENPVVYLGMAENTMLYKYFVDFNPAILLVAGLSMKK